jgi:hypothetical protein
VEPQHHFPIRLTNREILEEFNSIFGNTKKKKVFSKNVKHLIPQILDCTYFEDFTDLKRKWFVFCFVLFCRQPKKS